MGIKENIKNRFSSLRIKIKQTKFNLSRDVIGLDIGSENIKICTKNGKNIINEPSVVSYTTDNNINANLLYGKKAKEVLGKVPLNIKVLKPFSHGSVVDYKFASQMINYFLEKNLHSNTILSPILILNIHYSLNEIEKKTFQEILENSNSKEVYMIYNPIAISIGCNIPIDKPFGSMIIDIGGGKTEISVICLGEVIQNCSFNYGGETIDKSIISYIKQKYNLLIGVNMAEEIKKKIGAVYLIEGVDEIKTLKIQGRDLSTNKSQEITITQEDVVWALSEFSNLLISNIKEILDKTQPELIRDIEKEGAILCGGCSTIQNIDYIINKATNIKTHIQKQPSLCSIKGLIKIVENYKNYNHLLFKYNI